MCAKTSNILYSTNLFIFKIEYLTNIGTYTFSGGYRYVFYKLSLFFYIFFGKIWSFLFIIDKWFCKNQSSLKQVVGQQIFVLLSLYEIWSQNRKKNSFWIIKSINDNNFVKDVNACDKDPCRLVRKSTKIVDL